MACAFILGLTIHAAHQHRSRCAVFSALNAGFGHDDAKHTHAPIEGALVAADDGTINAVA